MYAVLKKKRTLMNNTRLYSIGCSSLNAGNRELTRILENTAAQQMLKRVDKPYSHEEAWETLTGRPMSTYSQAGLRMALSSWLNDLSSAEIRLPTPDELRTARVFACLYDRDATEIRQAVDRFYLLNTGTQEQMRSQAQQLAQKAGNRHTFADVREAQRGGVPSGPAGERVRRTARNGGKGRATIHGNAAGPARDAMGAPQICRCKLRRL